MLGKYINVYVFLISLTVGLLFVYLFQPELNVIYVYPTPDNQNKILYKDKTDNTHPPNFSWVVFPVPASTLSASFLKVFHSSSHL